VTPGVAGQRPGSPLTRASSTSSRGHERRGRRHRRAVGLCHPRGAGRGSTTATWWRHRGRHGWACSSPQPQATSLPPAPWPRRLPCWSGHATSTSGAGPSGSVRPGPSTRAARASRATPQPLTRPRASAVGAERLTGGADIVFDCVGSAASIEAALDMVRPRGRVVLVACPAGCTSTRRPLAPRGRPGRRLCLRDREGRGEHGPTSVRTSTSPSRRPPPSGPGASSLHLPDRAFRGGPRPRRCRRPAGRRQDRLRPALGASGHHERTDNMSRRPGFVLEVDRSTPPTLFWNGEGYGLERLPKAAG